MKVTRIVSAVVVCGAVAVITSLPQVLARKQPSASSTLVRQMQPMHSAAAIASWRFAPCE